MDYRGCGKYRKNITVSLKLIAYRRFMSEQSRILRAANITTKQTEIFRMAAQLYRIKRDSGQI